MMLAMDKPQEYYDRLAPSSFDDAEVFDRLAWEGAVVAARREFGGDGCSDAFLKVLWGHVRPLLAPGTSDED